MQANELMRTYSHVQYLFLMSYGIDLSEKDSYQSPIDFDRLDNWLGDDFNYIIDNILDDFLSDIEADLKSAWSSMKSE